MKIYASILVEALVIAIEQRSKYEREVLKYTGDSSAVATWKMLKDELCKDIERRLNI